MADESASPPLRIDAHVLVQLGQELVTDVEQAILECVKNAYDADSPGCKIVVRTDLEGQVTQSGLASKLLHFGRSAENVKVSFSKAGGTEILLTPNGEPVTSLPGSTEIVRRLSWTGSIVIEDEGDGLSRQQLLDSWLVISKSAKRAATKEQAKKKTDKQRTPLGDKGLGRLGTMKLGDILRVETAQSVTDPLKKVDFRWADCESAATVDEIPVHMRDVTNKESFKGTRVSVLGLHDRSEWKKSGRADEIVRGLAKLISPFEAASTFPVSIDIDGDTRSLVAVTDTLLKRAIASFSFDWRPAAEGAGYELHANAKFKEKLFRHAGSAKQQEKVSAVFDEDGGKAFLKGLVDVRRLKRFKIADRPTPGTFIELSQIIKGADLRPDDAALAKNPGPFNGAFYYFFLNDLQDGELDVKAAAGLSVDRKLVRDMAGISVLRDGFRVRSHGDWLQISAGMTTGSTYHLRPDNTLGYFALSGEHNYQLTEKSDREGFVEDAAYRGFLAVARACRNFANDALEEVRRAQDQYARTKSSANAEGGPKTPEKSLAVVESVVQNAARAQQTTSEVVGALEQGLKAIEDRANGASGTTLPAQAVTLFKEALDTAKTMQKGLEAGRHASAAVLILRQDSTENRERALSLYESAAVGLSARGLAHELRTHLTEIRKRLGNIEVLSASGNANESNLKPHLRAIRASCSSISGQAALIDPLLPRTRSLKESIDLEAFINDYFSNRAASLEKEGIAFQILVPHGSIRVRMNRGRLLQVLDNLIRNSVYWLRRGHDVLGVTRAKKIQVNVNEDGFSVADSGPGVDPAYEEAIFDIFVTAKPNKDDGQGLGLFITTQLLEADGCGIFLDSEKNPEGRKRKFTVNLGPALV